MKNRKNYTQTELQMIETAAQSRGVGKKIAKRVAKELKRSELGVYFQLMKYRKLQKSAISTTTAPIVAKPAKVAVKTTKDFVLNFTPKKTEVFQDHVRLYF